MGRIKNALIKRTARNLDKGENKFDETFENNKKLLASSMPSKRLRNGIAGYITRLHMNAKKKSSSEKVITE